MSINKQQKKSRCDELNHHFRRKLDIVFLILFTLFFKFEIINLNYTLNREFDPMRPPFFVIFAILTIKPNKSRSTINNF